MSTRAFEVTVAFRRIRALMPTNTSEPTRASEPIKACEPSVAFRRIRALCLLMLLSLL